jgi:hypothetical protein
MLDHPLRELLAGRVADVLLEHPAQRVAVAADREPNRKDKLIAEGAVIHGRPCSLFVLPVFGLSGWSLSIALVSIAIGLTSCESSFQEMAAAQCRGIAAETAYAECERRVSQQLADERLGYVMRSQMTGARFSGGMR